MADTTFTNGVTLTDADFFNDLNRLHYTLLQDPTAVSFVCNGRLTLTTAVPVTTADVTGAGTIYFTPYRGAKISLYDGSSNWKTYTFTELSLALTATSGKPYDVFIYDNAGTPTLETLVWTNDTTRATALALQNGVLVKSGVTTRRYLGTFYASGSNTTEDSVAKRYLWNYYNRVKRPMLVVESTASWTYTLETLRQARATATNQLDFVVGILEDPVSMRVETAVRSDTSNVYGCVGIGIDSTTANSASKFGPGNMCGVANVVIQIWAEYVGSPGIGRHTGVWLEKSQGVGVTTWNGTLANAAGIGGISGMVMA